MDVTIGQYRLTGLIGQGGMGAVYAADHALLGRSAAIKVLLPELSQKQDVVQRFFNEARAATAIRHPGIVEIYDFGWTADGAAYIVMEHLQGETLARRSERMRFGWQAALTIVRQIAGALAAAHAKGIVHRDLKPENVFLVPDPEVPAGERIKLLDFGIAKLARDVSSSAHVTRTGAVMGTPTYMAPEQCRGVAVDHRADLYALGCVMFQLCTGRPPFLGEGPGDVLAAHIHIPAPTLASRGGHVPPGVEQLVQRLLAKLPEQRVQTAEDVIRAIDAVNPERTAPVVSLTGEQPPPATPLLTTLSGAASMSSQLPGPARPRGRTIAMVCALAAAVTVVVVAVAMRAQEGSSADDGLRPAAAVVTEAAPPRPAPEPARIEPAPPPSAPVEPSRAPAAPAPAAPAPAAAASADAVEPPVASAPSPAPRVDSPPSDAEAPTVDASIESAPAGAQILLDGKVLGTTPFRGPVPRRDRNVAMVIRLSGYVDKTIMVRTDRSITKNVKLVRYVRPARPDPDQSGNPFAN